MKNKKLLIVGSGGHGRSVAEAAELMKSWDKISFIDDVFPEKEICSDWKIIGSLSDIHMHIDEATYVIVAIGHQKSRESICNKLIDSDIKLATIIHPSSIISPSSVINAGTVVLAGTVLGANTKIGIGSIININTSIDHDASLGSFVHLGVGVQIAGAVIIGDRAWLQVGTIVEQGSKIQAGDVIPAGTVINKI